MSVEDKIQSIEEIGQALSNRGNRRVVHCHGEFDLLHFGHTRYFKAAKRLGDILVVTLTPDRFIAKGPGRPVFNENQRAEAIANLEFVDYVGINQWPTALETLEIIRPNIYAKGNEYLKKKDVTGRLDQEKAKIESLGGQMAFTDDIVFSSSKLLNNHFDVFSEAAKPFLAELSQTTKATDLLALVDKIKGLKILVLGDFELAEQCLVEGGHAKLRRAFIQPSGALLGLITLKEFCELVDFLSVSTEDQSLIGPLIPASVFADLIVEPGLNYPTRRSYFDQATGFKRFSARHQTPFTPDPKVEEKILAKLEKKLGDYDLVLAFDNNGGVLSPKVRAKLGQKAKFLALLLGQPKAELAHQALADYVKVDYLAGAQRLFAKDAERWAKGAGGFKSGPALSLSDKQGGLTQIGKNGAKSLAPLVADSPQNLPIDWLSASFALAAPLKALGVHEDGVLLLCQAIGTLARQAASQPYGLEKMLFDKFVIALLNR
ncbi:MAG: hypothetical protein A2527_11950 [Candidatus Lambdaproteobacteria bacterium RIFOXYD2_FULL_50_16]|uniref:Cytidyltransferase-like domain-containing protein n=1 Tax=Candidatus Lambdaproteobacteria bacterium RIFOXYD2_FULL_50_16 TaxID=1817772 RepID=A0A1F6GD48_9PROT|nr:MAG: hypothetical protein A2527_11950 [Candidatus Lambdaproteobacteria bacterium RIFOXYD2_FULL_50_16]